MEGVPVETSAGLSPSGERKWGLLGGVVGAIAGGGSAITAVALDGAPWFEGGLYPTIFESRALLAIDLHLLGMLLAGAGFSAAGLVAARRSPFPRTEAYGAGLAGLILSVLAGSILFLRVAALVRAL